MSELNDAALEYAAKYGIKKYRVSGKYLVYFQNYRDIEYNAGEWRRRTRSYKRTVDLETLSVRTEQFPSIVQDGWCNV